jgi:hypothetical protein
MRYDGSMRACGGRPLRAPHTSHRLATMTTENAFEHSERAWFKFLVRENVERVRFVLGDRFDPHKH